MYLWDGLAVISGVVSVLFLGWCVAAAYTSFIKYEEVEQRPLPDVDDLPKWDKLNIVGQRANRELKKMYRGNLKL